MLTAAIAGGLALTVSIWVLIAAATKAPQAEEVHALVKTRFGHTCGVLSQPDDRLLIKVGDSEFPIPRDVKIKIVDDCPS